MLDNGVYGFIEEISFDILIYIIAFLLFLLSGSVHGYLDIIALIISSGIFMFIGVVFIRFIRFWRIFKISIPLYLTGLLASLVVTIVYAELSYKYHDFIAVSGFIIFLGITSFIFLKLKSLRTSKEWDDQALRMEEYRLWSRRCSRKNRVIMNFPSEMIDAVRKEQ